MSVRTLGYVGVESPEAKQWLEFGPEVLGLQPVDGVDPDTVYLRYDDRHHRLAVHNGERDRLAYVGWEVADARDLAELGDRLQAAGLEVHQATDAELEARKVRRMVWVEDPAGLRHELFSGQLSAPGAFRPGRPMAGGFVTGEQGMGHVVLVVPELEASVAFLGRLGFRVSDEIRTGMFDLSFLHCNPRHHSAALAQIPGIRGLHHVMIQLDDLDDVGVAYDIVQQRGLPITMSLGRHPNDRMVSFYVRTPSGFEVEYGWGAIEVADPWTAVSYDRASTWGHTPLAPLPPGAIEPVGQP